MRNQVLGYIVAVVMGFIASAAAAYGVELQPVQGAGPSTRIAQLFFEHFGGQPAAAGWKFDVDPKSTKHIGGIDASYKFLFGRSGRPLNDGELRAGKHEIALGRVAVGFVVGPGTGVKRISVKQLEDIYRGRIRNWKEAGGNDLPIILIGREFSEAVLSVLLKDFPFLRDASYQNMYTRDNQVTEYIASEKAAGALAWGVWSNFDAQRRLEVTGFSQGLSVGLVYDERNKDHPVVAAARAYAQTLAWRKIASEAGFAH